MKKITGFLLSAFTLFLISSCEQEEVEAGAEAFGSDFEAFGSALLTCGETGGGEVCPPCCFTFATVMGTIASGENGANRNANASRGLSKNNEIDILLPEQYKLENNPYECIGVTHNRLLFYILKNNMDFQIQGIINGNQNSLDRIIDIYSECNPESIPNRNEVIAHLRNNLTPATYQRDLVKYKTITPSQLFTSSNLSTENKGYFENVYSEVINIRKNNPNDIGPAMNFINSKIAENINLSTPLSSTQILRGSTLTLLKHSYYYWVN